MKDKELIALIVSESTREQGFRQLLSEYKERIYWHVRKMLLDHEDANDVTQEIFVKIWKNLDKFRADSQLYTWIYRIATNECLTFLNKKNKTNSVGLEDVDASIYAQGGQAQNLDADYIQHKLSSALSILPDKQRLVFNMKYFDELKYEEISEITDTSVGALKTSYHLAVKKIEEYLKTS